MFIVLIAFSCRNVWYKSSSLWCTNALVCETEEFICKRIVWNLYRICEVWDMRDAVLITQCLSKLSTWCGSAIPRLLAHWWFLPSISFPTHHSKLFEHMSYNKYRWWSAKWVEQRMCRDMTHFFILSPLCHRIW